MCLNNLKKLPSQQLKGLGFEKSSIKRLLVNISPHESVKRGCDLGFR